MGFAVLRTNPCSLINLYRRRNETERLGSTIIKILCLHNPAYFLWWILSKFMFNLSSIFSTFWWNLVAGFHCSAGTIPHVSLLNIPFSTFNIALDYALDNTTKRQSKKEYLVVRHAVTRLYHVYTTSIPRLYHVHTASIPRLYHARSPCGRLPKIDFRKRDMNCAVWG